MLILLFVSFFVSLVLVIVARQKLSHFARPYPNELRQRIHHGHVPRLGGLAMFLAYLVTLFCGWLIDDLQEVNLGLRLQTLLGLVGVLSLPVFIGIKEDFTHGVSVSLRLLFTALGAFIAIIWLDLNVTRLGLNVLDDLLAEAPLFGVIIAFLGLVGLPHAFNIVDGFNGQCGFVSAVITTALIYLALGFGDRELATYAICMLGVTLGFLVWNYPHGLIFAGDGGAYFWGFNIATISIMLVQRHHEVSPWFPILLLCYPVCETTFSIYRKLVRGISPTVSDTLHLHHLIYRRVVRPKCNLDESKMLITPNSQTMPYLLLLTLLTVVPALLFWNNTPVLIGFCGLFVISYLSVYMALIKFKVPRWLRRLIN